MTGTIDVYVDYVCPYCLLAESIIRPAIQDTGVQIRWRPFELRPHPTPTLRVEDPYLPQVWRRSVYPLAEQLGVPIVLPDISPQPRTQRAFELFQLAERHGLGDAFSVRSLQAFFQEQRDIGDVEVLVALAEEVGLDPKAARATLDQGTFRETHQAALRHAYDEAQISGVPTVFAGERRITGLPNPQELRDLVGGLVASPATA